MNFLRIEATVTEHWPKHHRQTVSKRPPGEAQAAAQLAVADRKALELIGVDR
ncbi:hypothetical protein [Cribrihabitans pelagius]|uniref:hypothetical protein n=1 Tax=Cribrihabitans pelagius TaxID=1765746 RepID=UPI003B5C957F